MGSSEIVWMGRLRFLVVNLIKSTWQGGARRGAHQICAASALRRLFCEEQLFASPSDLKT
jgi:hypothetical protein